MEPSLPATLPERDELEERVSALRDRVRAAGAEAERVGRRWNLVGFLLVFVGGYLVIDYLSLPGWTSWPFSLMVVLGLYGRPFARRLRVRRQRELVHSLRELPPESRERVLETWALDDGELRRLVRGLRRDVSRPQELAPAATPEGRGSELSDGG